MLLAFTEIGEGRCQYFVHNPDQVNKFGKRLRIFSRFVEPLCRSGHHLSVLHDLETLQDVRYLAAGHALDHEIIATRWHLNNGGTIVRSVATETDNIPGKIIKFGPIIDAGIAGALEPVQLL